MYSYTLTFKIIYTTLDIKYKIMLTPKKLRNSVSEDLIWLTPIQRVLYTIKPFGKQIFQKIKVKILNFHETNHPKKFK